MPSPTLVQRLEPWWRGDSQLTLLTGAGVSAESGIPTFRGPEGYWQRGSTQYQPQQLATARLFEQEPGTVWSWYLHRFAVCQAAQPNAAHRAISRLERHAPTRFTLITQNVDGLHLRAGNSVENTLQIHGQIDRRRCAGGCCQTLWPMPAHLPIVENAETLDETTLREALACPECGGLTRPHILWFDECYDETFYRMDTALMRASESDTLIIVGTSGATTLPQLLVKQAIKRGTQLIEVNPEPSAFTDAIEAHGGHFIPTSAGHAFAALSEP